jgi:NitT/TauT family transport system substrate-binding protein
MRRRNHLMVFGVGLAVVVAAGCASAGGTSRGDDSVTDVSYAGAQEEGTAGYAAALTQGYFAGQGLTFSPTWSTSGSVILQAVVGGSVDLANVGPAQLFQALKNGACARVLRPTEGAAYSLIAQPRLHLNSTLPYPDALKQLKGLTIGVAAIGAAQELVIAKLLKDAGLNPATDVTWVAIGGGAAAVAAFAADKVDVAVSYSQLDVNLRANRTNFDQLLNLSGPHTPLGAFWQAVAVVNCGWADTHHSTVLRLCRALNQGFAALANNPATGPRVFAYLKVGSSLAESTALWTKWKGPVIQIPALNRLNWTHQAWFTPDDYTPSFSKYVVRGCAAA